MPLSDHIPRLDDRRFEDLVAEARARIPQYTPEWTDYNPGDAGFALIELFAWLSELLVYRMGRVPELNYLKFLELVGIELTPARPAQTVLVFPVKPGFAGSSVTVPARTPVAAAEPDEQGPILFETERVLTALKAQLDALQVFDGYAYADVSAANADLATSFQPFGPLARAETALLLGFSGDSALPPSVELSLAFWPPSDRPVPPPAPCGGGVVPVAAPARLAWEFWAGSEWRPLTLLSDDTLALTRSGLVRLRTPPPGQATPAKLGKKQDKARFWLRARLEQAAYEVPPALLGVRANAVRALQAQSVAREVLGGSEGTPSQVFRLANAPVLAGTLALEVDETGSFEAWREVEDFFGSGPDDRHYLLNRTTGEIRFGDGRRGRVPVANLAAPQSNVVAAFYRFGGGTRGNLGAGLVATLMRSLPGIDVGKVTNPLPAEGGTEEESLEAAAGRAPVALKARDRAVTAEDFEMLARQAGPVRRAHTLPLAHPHFPGIDVPGVVTLLIVPDAPGPAPSPSEALAQTVCAHLDRRRLLTTELYVIGPSYLGVEVRLEVVAAADADAAVLTLDIEAAVATYLHPLTGGADGQGWPFGGTLFYGELYRRALLAGVERLPELVVSLEGVEQAPCQDVPLPRGALLRVDGVSVSVRSAEELETVS
ncbi:MAG: putative baseplate assembly protein [Tistlia sp.]|uniref:putative baseplate assembly protein n=1 Tax=Tistlia sp. TaxID=3057121 RepID=UPI0034A2DB7C